MMSNMQVNQQHHVQNRGRQNRNANIVNGKGSCALDFEQLIDLNWCPFLCFTFR